ncbi:uncharacterized protein FOMMEDRAFT_71930 [Fomitiporia mediterranea MF3/22]|uniref:uncharacterized protein n=1 Tax=Fomitiporia mediterranea (strain MF3/22) TaxID=694068 RepID=UPI0004407F15|nr:uncharacterized protein FOMMEDRAFT_71930 [Fomitiporia mediterranea MF3/22]EJD07935.1 hypothetical protein FOMMEDRAFT_71930 [Fomitiporia mediterranea MF3/22]
MGSDYCSAPAMLVDAEQAFSIRQCQINFMQHNTSSDTFRAQMAVSSWDGTPLFPHFKDAINIIESKKSGST